MRNKNKIIKKIKEPQCMVKTTLSANIENDKPIFSFTHFNGHSIRIDGFNNYYSNSQKSTNAVYSFIDKIKNMQQKTIKELTSGKIKNQLHFHPIEGKREIERINDVLLNGYHFSKDMVMNFENSYYEFSLDNGSRVIFVKIDNIFELLFIDNNHMIYKESSRILKHKESYSYPSCLGKINFSYDYDEKSTREILEIMLEAYKNGEFDNLNDFVNNLKELIYDYVDN